MSLVVNTNVGSLNAQRSLAAASAELKTAMERLSSGKRINSAADDAAGFAIAERMTSQLLGLNQGIKNVADAQSMLAVAEGGLQSITDILQRTRELEVQYLNDTNSDSDRAYLKEEAAALLAEIDRIAKQTSFNGQALLADPSEKLISLGGESSISIDLQSANLEELGLKSWTLGQAGLEMLESEVQVNTHTASDQRLASLGRLSEGRYIVGWNSYAQDGSDLGVFAQIYNSDGSKFGQEFQINSYTNSVQYYPVFTGFDDGGFVAAWRTQGEDGGFLGTAAQLFDADGQKIGNSFIVNTRTSGAQINVQMATLSDGNWVATWMDSTDGSEYGVYGQVFDQSGNRIGNEFLANTYTDNQQGYHSIAALKDGGFFVTWHSMGQDGDGTGIFGQFFDNNGSKSGSEFQINAVSDDYQVNPKIAELKDGSLAVVWQEFDSDVNPDEASIWSRTINLDRTLSDEQFKLVDLAHRPGIHFWGDVTSSRDGYLVTWYGVDADSNRNVFAQKFNVDGSSVGQKQKINQGISSGTNYPSPAALELTSGDVLIAYHLDQDADGDGMGVFTRRVGVSGGLKSIDSALSIVSSEQAAIGATSNRLDYAFSNLLGAAEEIALARSQIQDADYAKESARLAKAQVLQQAATAMLAQANAQPQLALSLIR